MPLGTTRLQWGATQFGRNENPRFSFNEIYFDTEITDKFIKFGPTRGGGDDKFDTTHSTNII